MYVDIACNPSPITWMTEQDKRNMKVLILLSLLLSLCVTNEASLCFPLKIKARNDEIRKIQSDLNNVERNQQETLKRIRMETESAEMSETKNSEGRR